MYETGMRVSYSCFARNSVCRLSTLVVEMGIQAWTIKTKCVDISTKRLSQRSNQENTCRLTRLWSFSSNLAPMTIIIALILKSKKLSWKKLNIPQGCVGSVNHARLPVIKTKSDNINAFSFYRMIDCTCRYWYLKEEQMFWQNGLTVVGVGNDVERVDVSWTRIHDGD